MKKLAFIPVILILLALLFLFATVVSASPAIILEPSFETVVNWTFSQDDPGSDYTGGQSTVWVTQGTYSYLIESIGNIGTGTYGQILQSVNFTQLDTICFDANLWAESALIFRASVLVGTTEVWGQDCPTTATDYLHQEIDVSAYTGLNDLIFRVTNVSGSPALAAEDVYFDNIKTWGSFNDSAHTTVDNSFGAGENTVYMYGENFDASTAYHIGYYDGDGVLVLSEAQTSTSAGELSGQCYFPTYQETAVAGT
jgi:hypothetical protein